MSHLARLVAHLGWADRRALAALRAAGPSAGQAVDLLAHVLAAEHVWLARLEGRPATLKVWPTLTLDECERVAEQNLAGLTALVGRLLPADLQRDCHYRNTAGQEFTSTVEDILLHVCLHGSYHRGQIAKDLRTAGAEPNPTDFIAFVRGAPAARRA